MSNVDTSYDPCAICKTLRDAYLALLGGSRAESVEYVSSGGVSRRLTFSRTNSNELRDAVASFQAECDKLQGRSPRRYAIATGGGNSLPGSRRHDGQWWWWW